MDTKIGHLELGKLISNGETKLSMRLTVDYGKLSPSEASALVVEHGLLQGLDNEFLVGVQSVQESDVTGIVDFQCGNPLFGMSQGEALDDDGVAKLLLSTISASLALSNAGIRTRAVTPKTVMQEGGDFRLLAVDTAVSKGLDTDPDFIGIAQTVFFAATHAELAVIENVTFDQVYASFANQSRLRLSRPMQHFVCMYIQRAFNLEVTVSEAQNVVGRLRPDKRMKIRNYLYHKQSVELFIYPTTTNVNGSLIRATAMFALDLTNVPEFVLWGEGVPLICEWSTVNADFAIRKSRGKPFAFAVLSQLLGEVYKLRLTLGEELSQLVRESKDSSDMNLFCQLVVPWITHLKETMQWRHEMHQRLLVLIEDSHLQIKEYRVAVSNLMQLTEKVFNEVAPTFDDDLAFLHLVAARVATSDSAKTADALKELSSMAEDIKGLYVEDRRPVSRLLHLSDEQQMRASLLQSSIFQQETSAGFGYNAQAPKFDKAFEGIMALCEQEDKSQAPPAVTRLASTLMDAFVQAAEQVSINSDAKTLISVSESEEKLQVSEAKLNALVERLGLWQKLTKDTFVNLCISLVDARTHLLKDLQFKVQSLKDEVAKLENSNDQKTQVIAQLETRIAQLTEELQAQNQEVQALTQRITSTESLFQKKLSEIELEYIQRHAQNTELAERKLSEMSEQATKANDQLQDSLRKYEQISNLNTELTAQVATLKRSLDDCRRTLQAERGRIPAGLTMSTLVRNSTSIQELTQDLAETSAELDKTKESLEQVKVELDMSNDALEKEQLRSTTFQLKEENAKKDLQELQRKFDAFKSEQVAATASLNKTLALKTEESYASATVAEKLKKQISDVTLELEQRKVLLSKNIQEQETKSRLHEKIIADLKLSHTKEISDLKIKLDAAAAIRDKEFREKEAAYKTSAKKDKAELLSLMQEKGEHQRQVASLQYELNQAKAQLQSAYQAKPQPQIVTVANVQSGSQDEKIKVVSANLAKANELTLMLQAKSSEYERTISDLQRRVKKAEEEKAQQYAVAQSYEGNMKAHVADIRQKNEMLQQLNANLMSAHQEIQELRHELTSKQSLASNATAQVDSGAKQQLGMVKAQLDESNRILRSLVEEHKQCASSIRRLETEKSQAEDTAKNQTQLANGAHAILLELLTKAVPLSPLNLAPPPKSVAEQRQVYTSVASDLKRAFDRSTSIASVKSALVTSMETCSLGSMVIAVPDPEAPYRPFPLYCVLSNPTYKISDKSARECKPWYFNESFIIGKVVKKDPNPAARGTFTLEIEAFTTKFAVVEY